MKKMFLISLICVFSLHSWAQEETLEEMETTTSSTPAQGRARRPTSMSYTMLGVGYMMWNQDLHLEQGGTKTSAPANYQGMTINVQRETLYRRWGWSVAGIIGSGRANGGDPFDPTITYAETKQAWSVFGVSPRLFYRLTGRVNMGISAPLMLKTIEWPTNSPTLSVDGGKKFLASGMVDFAVRLGNKWEIYQGIGPASNDGETLWRVNLNYRL